MLIVVGPRQVGKSTLVQQILDGPGRPAASRQLLSAELVPLRATVDDSARHLQPYALSASIARSGAPNTIDADWLIDGWRRSEAAATAWAESGHPAAATMPYALAIDEIHRVPQWSSVVKGLWDRTRSRGISMHVVLLGSAPILLQKGLTESLLGRFEVLRLGHWSFEEMSEAFGVSVDEFVYFGGFPGAATYMADEPRWRAYVRDALIAPNIDRDVFEMARVDKPALLRGLFDLGCAYSGQILSLDKVRGQLGGHTMTLDHQLTLLSQAGLLRGLQKYAAQSARQRRSPPKFLVHNTALMAATSHYAFDEARADRSHWGRMVESAAGAHLVNTADGDTGVYYWRDGDDEVDFVVEHHGRLAAIEVKSGLHLGRRRGLHVFKQRYPTARLVVVGGADMPLGEFLRRRAASWTD